MAALPDNETARICPHIEHPHRHGTRAAYLADRCRCPRCRRANRVAEAHRTRAIAMGRWNPYVDARETHEHLQQLRKAGLGIDRIVAMSGVPRSTVRRLLMPIDLADGTRPRRIRPDIARQLLNIDSDVPPTAPRSVVDAGPTRHRIAELRAAGHSIGQLARALGRSPASLSRTLERPVVTIETARAIERLHRPAGRRRDIQSKSG